MKIQSQALAALTALIIASAPFPAVAQDNTTTTAPATTPAATPAADNNDDGFDLGWIGILGLAGLLGLRRRDEHVRTTTTRGV